MGGRTADVARLVERDREGDGAEDEDGRDHALGDVRELQLAQLDEVVADPAVLSAPAA